MSEALDQRLIVGINPGIHYLWTDGTGKSHVAWYVSEELQSGISELWDAIARNQVRGHVEVRQLDRGLYGAATIWPDHSVPSAFDVLEAARKNREP